MHRWSEKVGFAAATHALALQVCRKKDPGRGEEDRHSYRSTENFFYTRNHPLLPRQKISRISRHLGIFFALSRIVGILRKLTIITSTLVNFSGIFLIVAKISDDIVFIFPPQNYFYTQHRSFNSLMFKNLNPVGGSRNRLSAILI